MKSKSVSLSVVSDSAIPWTTACKAPLFMEFSRKEYHFLCIAFSCSRGSSQPRDWIQVFLLCRWIFKHVNHQRSLFISTSSVSSVTQTCLTLCDPMVCCIPGFPVHHQLPELAQTHVHRVSDATRPSHLPSAPSPPTFNLSQHQDLFQWVSSSHQVAKILRLQLQHQSFQWIFRTDLL